VSNWREISRAVIQEVKDANPGATREELGRLCSKAYPFGIRKHHPYKIWCDEVNKQIGESIQKQRARQKQREQDLKAIPELPLFRSSGGTPPA
jgi:hypothetical protein